MDVNDQHWQKGNLHTHSFWSDGDDFPEMIIDWYKENDYQFIALSDHNTIANDDDYWYRLKQSDLKNKTFEKYKKRFVVFTCLIVCKHIYCVILQSQIYIL